MVDACRMENWNDYEAVKPDTTYKLSIKYWGRDIEGPRNPGRAQYGLVGKNIGILVPELL